MHNIPLDILDKAYDALIYWALECNDDEAKKVTIPNEKICIRLLMKALPYEDDLYSELATMGEKWKAAFSLMSEFYDRDKRLFELWVKVNGLPDAFYLQNLVEFDELFKILKTYRKLDAYIDVLIEVYRRTQQLYNKLDY